MNRTQNAGHVVNAPDHVTGADVVTDELALLASLVALEDARVIELGCGAGDFARALVERTAVASVAAYEVDKVQHRKNAARPALARFAFAFGGAESIALPDASIDGVLMMKSLHHVPMVLLDRALFEIARVLRPEGWLYVSEPVYEGEFNELVKLFHDEGVVRDAAYKALGRAHLRGVLHEEREVHFMAPVAFRDFDDFDRRMIQVTHSNLALDAEGLARVRAKFEGHMTPQGARFTRPMRVNLMRKP